MQLRTLALLGAGLLAGCATAGPQYPPSLPPPPPPRPMLRPAPELGPATLIGRFPANIRGASWNCEGQSVVVLPATAATVARMRGLYGSTVEAASPVETVRRRAATLARDIAPDAPVATAACSDSGGFTVPGLRPGSYYVIARARLTGAGAGGGGGAAYALMHRADARAGETVEVIMAPPPIARPAAKPRAARPRTPRP